MTITIDSVNFDVPIKTLKRKADMLYKYAERTEDGVLHSEMIGVFFNFDFSAGMSVNNVTSYASLWSKLTEAANSHTISVLGTSFSCYFANINDEVVKDKTTDYFRNLTFSVIAISPAVVPA